MAAGPDKVYHEGQCGLWKAPASVCSSHRELGSLPHWHMHRGLKACGGMKAGGFSHQQRLVTQLAAEGRD